MENLLFKNEVYKIIGVCMEIHRTLGYGFLEIVYKDAMELDFQLRNMVYSREQEYNVCYRDTILKHGFFADFTLFDKIIVEVKANKDGIASESIAQTLNYLKASGCPLGLVINFGKTSLEYKRLIF